MPLALALSVIKNVYVRVCQIIHCAMALRFILLLSLGVASTYGDVKVVVGLTDADYAERYRFTYRLGTRLTPSDRETLETFLARKPESKSLSISELAAIKNNVADALIAQEEIPESLAGLFFSMFADATQGDLWHGYIVQKIPELAQRLKSPVEVRRAVEFLWSQLRVGGRFPTEAALGLGRLQEARPDLIAKEEIAERFRDHLASTETTQESKRVVVQLLAKYDATAAANEARRFLVAAESGTMLKASAIATLGLVGSKDDRRLVEPYLTSVDIRLSEAAKTTLKRLQQR